MQRLTRGRRAALPWAILSLLLLIALGGLIVRAERMIVAERRAALMAEWELRRAEMASQAAEAESRRRQEAQHKASEAPMTPPRK